MTTMSSSPKLLDSGSRLIVVANRLPVTITLNKSSTPLPPEEKYTFKASSGGLVSALSGCKKQMSFTWFGWPGLFIPESDRKFVEEKLDKDFSCKPVYLDDDLADKHYNGFANSILWPLFHYHPGEMSFDESAWHAYREANLLFAETVYKEIQEGDIVWVQDYHLMLLPLLLRYLLSPSPSTSMSHQSLREIQRIKEGLYSSLSTPFAPITTLPDGSPSLKSPLEDTESITLSQNPASVSDTDLSGGNSPRRTRSVSRSSTASGATGVTAREGFRKATKREVRDSWDSNATAGGNGNVVGASGSGRKAFERGKVKIGFFLHTPFPSSEIYRILPVRREILLGILHCDLIGFHTYDYARHFLSSCTRILGLPTMPNGVEFEGHYTYVGTFPIGIDPLQFHDNLQKEQVQKRIKTLEQKFEGMKILVGVDRLDYIKGVPQKLHALEVFLTKHPEWIGKVVLVQVAVPSRGDVDEYRQLRNSVNEMVGRINGQFGTVEYTPIHFLHKSVNFDELCALYAVSEGCLITSTRDGMNLVSYEYVACQEARHGVLVLSEFAGAAHSLNGSIIVNPWNTDEVAEGIHKAVTMSPENRKESFDKLFKYVSKFTASYWGVSFVSELQHIKIKPTTSQQQPTRRPSLTHLSSSPYRPKSPSSLKSVSMASKGRKSAGGTPLPSQMKLQNDDEEDVEAKEDPEQVVV